MHNIEQETKEHREILDALEKRDVNKAKEKMFKHIQASIDYLK